MRFSLYKSKSFFQLALISASLLPAIICWRSSLVPASLSKNPVGRKNFEDIAAAVEAVVWDEQQILPSLDWPAARLLHYLGLDADLFVPLFVISRMVGWAAHYIEQQQSPQTIRPRGIYTGPPNREFEMLNERG